MRYRKPDGSRYTAETYPELVRELWRSDVAAPPTLEEWMQASADHAALWQGITLRTDSENHHIEDMLASGLLEALPNED